MWRGPNHSLPACLIPTYLIDDIFVLTGNIGGRGRRRAGWRGRTQDPKGQQRWEEGIREDYWEHRGGEGRKSKGDNREDRGDRDDGNFGKQGEE